MPKPVKKIETTYEAFQWDGSNEKELEEWGIYDIWKNDGTFGDASLSVTYYEPEINDYIEVWMSVGDALVKPSRGKYKYLSEENYAKKFEYS